MADGALSDYISQKQIGQRLGLRPNRVTSAPKSGVYNRLSSASLATTMKAKPALTEGSDARNKIIQLKRKNIIDARDHLGSLAKKVDARAHLNKMNNGVAVKSSNGPLQNAKEPTDMRDKLNRKSQATANVQPRTLQQQMRPMNPPMSQPMPMGAPARNNFNTTITRTINTGRSAPSPWLQEPARMAEPIRNVQPPTRTIQQPIRNVVQPRRSVHQRTGTVEQPSRTIEQPTRTVQPRARAAQPIRTTQVVRSAPAVRKVIKQVPQPIRTVTVPRTRTIRSAPVQAVRKVYRQPVEQEIVYEDDPYDVEYVEEPYMEVLEEEPLYEEPMYDELYEEPGPVYRPRPIIVKKQPYVQQAQRAVSYQSRQPIRRQVQPQPIRRQAQPQPLLDMEPAYEPQQQQSRNFMPQQQSNNFPQQQSNNFSMQQQSNGFQQQPGNNFMTQQQQSNNFMPQQQQGNNFMPQQSSSFMPQQQQGNNFEQQGFYGNKSNQQQQQQPLMDNMQYGPTMPPMQQQNQFAMQRPMQQPQQRSVQQQPRQQQQQRTYRTERTVQDRTNYQRQDNSNSRAAPRSRAVDTKAPSRAPAKAAVRSVKAPIRAPVKAPVKTAPKVSGHRVSVSNLHPIATADDIEELFENIGEVVSAKMVTVGTVVVVFRTLPGARKAVEVYHNRKLDGQPMQVKILGTVYDSK